MICTSTHSNTLLNHDSQQAVDSANLNVNVDQSSLHTATHLKPLPATSSSVKPKIGSSNDCLSPLQSPSPSFEDFGRKPSIIYTPSLSPTTPPIPIHFHSPTSTMDHDKQPAQTPSPISPGAFISNTITIQELPPLHPPPKLKPIPFNIKTWSSKPYLPHITLTFPISYRILGLVNMLISNGSFSFY